jgi:hypothetical protein
MKYLFIFLSAFLFFSCAEEDSTNNNSDDYNNESDTSISLNSQSININSNISNVKYLVKLQDSSSTSNSLKENSISTNTVSGDSSTGYVYGLNSSDQIVSIFQPFDIGTAKDIVVSGDYSLISGEFKVDSTTCLLLFSTGDHSNCLAIKQDNIGSIRANFLKKEILILIANSSNGLKELYNYNLNSGFTEVSTNKLSSNIFSVNAVELDGEVVDSYASGDSAFFYIKSETSSNLLSIKNNNGSYEIKEEKVTSDSVQDINGEPIFMSDGNLRMGYDKSISYNQSSNNRNVSTNNVLVDLKDSKFQFYYQSNYNFHGFSNPSIFYLKPKRSDLPSSYPDYTLERINCCQAKNNPSGTRDSVEEMNWEKVSGYKNYVIAYGEFAGTEYPEYSASNIVIDKAIILINANSYDAEPLGDAMARISLYDYNNTSSEEDNLINPLSYDTVTSVVNYINGFKLTGKKYGQEKITYYNPVTNNIEFPNTSDQQSFTIKESL